MVQKMTHRLAAVLSYQTTIAIGCVLLMVQPLFTAEAKAVDQALGFIRTWECSDLTLDLIRSCECSRSRSGFYKNLCMEWI